jgi:hypothetical protein
MERPAMTKINYAEYDSLKSFDQALVWAVIRLREANLHPDNKDLLDYVTIRPEAREFIKWSPQLDDQGQPYFTASLLFPLIDSQAPVSRQPSALVSKSIPAHIPTYTDFELPPSPMDIPATGRGMPKPEIPAAIDTLERLLCWLCLIGYVHGDLVRYINGLNSLAFVTNTAAAGKPDYSITTAGLRFFKSISESELYAQRGAASGGNTTAADAFAAFDGTPQNPNNNDLAEKLEDLREEQRANAEPPQADPGKGYDRIDTLPVCKDQDPSIKAFNTPLAKLLK